MTTETPVVHLLGEGLVPLVRAAAALEATGLPPFAVIGGVAVAVRLRRIIRATADLDAVTDYTYAPTALEIMIEREDTVSDPNDRHTITIGGAQVQFQEVVGVRDEELDGFIPRELLFLGGHAHALVGASPVTLTASDAGGRVRATVPVAPAGALVAMKLHAFLDRRGPGVAKRPGDVWDVYNLLLHASEDAAADLRSTGRLLPEAVAATVQDVLIDHAPKTRAVLRQSSDERYQAITADELSHEGSAFISRLRVLT